MSVESHDYIIIAIIAGIIILQVYVFAVNIGKIKDYKKTIRQAKNFEIIEVEVPEEWIKEIEVKEILGNPEAFRESSANFTKNTIDEVSGNKTNSPMEVFDNTEYEDSIYKNNTSSGSPIKKAPVPEELNFHQEELELESEIEENEIEEYEENDFEFEEEEYKINNKPKR